jgi:hypothetical protein
MNRFNCWAVCCFYTLSCALRLGGLLDYTCCISQDEQFSQHGSPKCARQLATCDHDVLVTLARPAKDLPMFFGPASGHPKPKRRVQTHRPAGLPCANNRLEAREARPTSEQVQRAPPATRSIVSRLSSSLIDTPATKRVAMHDSLPLLMCTVSCILSTHTSSVSLFFQFSAGAIGYIQV